MSSNSFPTRYGTWRIARLYGLFIALLVLLAGCRQDHAWRQKLTVTVETPAGEVSGAAVVEVRAGFWEEPPIGTTEVVYGLRGEATAVELGPGRWLFALLGGSEERFYWSARDRFPGMPRGDWLHEIPRQTEPVELTGARLPMLVTFADIDDPASVMRVDPDDLEAAFGCDRTTGLEQAPWRAAGTLYRQWVEDETWRRANAGASARAGLTGEAAAALGETFRIDKPAYGPNAAEREQIAALSHYYTPEQRQAWRDAREALLREIPATLPTPDSLSAPDGGPCHRLTSVSLEITREPVTEGRVEEVLEWLGPYPEPALQPGDGRIQDIPFAMTVHHGEFMQRTTE